MAIENEFSTNAARKQHCGSSVQQCSESMVRPRMSDGRVSRVVWKPKDYGILCTFLEKRENFEMLHGSAGKTSIGENHPTKKSANSAAAALLLGMGIEGPLDGEAFMKKYQRYQAMYKKAKGFQSSTGSGLTEADLLKGITLPQKLEKTCPHFARADAIYGERPNISPLATLELGSGGNSLGLDGEQGEEEEYGVDDCEMEEDDESEVQPHEATQASIFASGAYIDVDAAMLNSQVPSSPTEILRGNFDSQSTDILSETKPVITVADDTDPEWMDLSPPLDTLDNGVQSLPSMRDSRGGSDPAQQVGTPGKGGPSNRNRHVGSTKRLQRKEVSVAPSAVNKPATKPNLVDMFGQRMAQKGKDHAFALASKERWKRAELEDKKESRHEEAKRARIERQSKAKLARESNKYNLLIELAKLGRPIEEMKAIMDMSDLL